MSKCAGQDSRFVTARDFPCPHCGAPVEIFSDERRRRCPSCGGEVTREADLKCAAWCPSARSCLGEKRYREMVDAKTAPGEGEQR